MTDFFDFRFRISPFIIPNLLVGSTSYEKNTSGDTGQDSNANSYIRLYSHVGSKNNTIWRGIRTDEGLVVSVRYTMSALRQRFDFGRCDSRAATDTGVGSSAEGIQRESVGNWYFILLHIPQDKHANVIKSGQISRLRERNTQLATTNTSLE